MHFECAQRVLVICRDEYHADVRTDKFQNLETIQLRHLNIEEYKVRIRLCDHSYRFKAVATFANNLDLRVRLQHLADHLARQIFIVDDQRANLISDAHAGLSAGRLNATLNLSPLV